MGRHHIDSKGKARHIAGWRPSRPDHRDIVFQPKSFGVVAPQHLDISSGCSQVEDQSTLGSCTANASTDAVEFLAKKHGHLIVQLSRLFTYYASRVWVEGVAASEDSGCMIRDVMRALARYGVCAETTMPYDISLFAQAPTAAAQTEALKHRIMKYLACPTLDIIKHSIIEGYPVVGGFSVYDSMMSDQVSANGHVPYPTNADSQLGGHAILYVGFDDMTRLLKFKNSWSVEWGDKGYGYLPYRYPLSGLATDAWTIRTALGA